MSPTDTIVVLDPATIEALALEASRVRQAVQDILVEAAEGRAGGGLKTQVNTPAGAYFQALPAFSTHHGLAAVKWVAVMPPRPGQPSIAATILLNDIGTGAPVAALDGGWITRARTGALSAIAANALAPPNAGCIGLIGAGAQARAHVIALREVRPSLRHVTVYDSSRGVAEGVAGWVEALGLKARVVDHPAAAVGDQDVVVSTVPAAGLAAPLLDAEWLADDCFVSMVDLGRSWRAESLHRFSLVATDDAAQSKALAQAGKLPYAGEYDFTLTDFALGRRPSARAGCNALIFGGIGLADLAVAALVSQTLRHGERVCPGPGAPPRTATTGGGPS